jgi:putative tryptophan/tyrosine transport system substrate-binding protein
VKRREFIALFGGAAITYSFAARAQQPAVIGYLHSRGPDDAAHLAAAFRRGLRDGGFIDGQNIRIEYRWAHGQFHRLPAMAQELVRMPVAALVAGGGEPAAMTAKAATSTIPIVFAMSGDPVKLGLAASFNRPGGNVTGMNILTTVLAPKRLGLLHDLVPAATTIGFLGNPSFPPSAEQVIDAEEAARAIGVRIRVASADNEQAIDAAFETFARSASLRSQSPALPSSIRAASRSSRWRRATPCLPSTIFASTPLMAASSATESIMSTCTARSGFTRAKFSRVPNPATCRSCSRRSSISSST